MTADDMFTLTTLGALAWWRVHQYDSDCDDLYLYGEPPKFVKTALAAFGLGHINDLLGLSEEGDGTEEEDALAIAKLILRRARQAGHRMVVREEAQKS